MSLRYLNIEYKIQTQNGNHVVLLFNVYASSRKPIKLLIDQIDLLESLNMDLIYVNDKPDLLIYVGPRLTLVSTIFLFSLTRLTSLVRIDDEAIIVTFIYRYRI